MRYLILCSAFSLALLSPASWAEKILTQLDHQKVITVKPKEHITIKLPSDPSTGYLWFMEGSDHDALKMVQDWKFTPRVKNDRPVIGDTTWRFTAQQEGEVTLRFVYRKPWQGKDVDPLDIREYTLIISAHGAQAG